MKLLLIAPSSGRWRTAGRARWFNGRTFRFSLLSLLSVAAETPAGVAVRIVDEQVEDIPWNPAEEGVRNRRAAWLWRARLRTWLAPFRNTGRAVNG